MDGTRSLIHGDQGTTLEGGRLWTHISVSYRKDDVVYACKRQRGGKQGDGFQQHLTRKWEGRWGVSCGGEYEPSKMKSLYDKKQWKTFVSSQKIKNNKKNGASVRPDQKEAREGWEPFLGNLW